MKQPTTVLLCLLLAAGSFLCGYRLSHHPMAQCATDGGRRVLYFVDPMNPAHTSDQPGFAPCGMKLEPVYADTPSAETGRGSLTPLPPGAVQVSPQKQQLIGLRVGQATRSAGTGTLRVLGRVALDETRVYRLSTPVDGLVRSTGSNVTGNLVAKDEVLATFYNRDFLTAQQSYLYALNTMDRFKDKESEEQLKLTRAQMQAAEENLEFLGMGHTQMREVARTRQIARIIELRSPVAGLVVARNVFPGLRFERGAELFRLAELDQVWILADLYGKEAAFVQPGTKVRVSLPDQGRTFTATVSRTLPQFDAVSRTLKLRLESANPDLVLKPDMFVDVEVPFSLPEALVIPAEAVVDSGRRKTVFVASDQDFFEPRSVRTGWRYEDQVQILEGLTPGERIVISGNFLLDSESRMKLASLGFQGTPARDPVCGMPADEAKAKAADRQWAYRGTTYYFCSKACQQRFERDPNGFAPATHPHRMEMAAPPSTSASPTPTSCD